MVKIEGYDIGIESLINQMLLVYVRNIRAGKKIDLNNTYEWIEKGINNDERKNPGQEKKYNRLHQIATSFYNLISNPDIIDEIKNTDIKDQEFVDKYKEQILGDKKRQYDMSSLYDSSSIASTHDRKKRKEAFVPSGEKIEFEFLDENNNAVRVIKLGDMMYEEWNGTRTNMSMYRVQREIEKGQFLENLVYTNIIIPKMSEPEYRKAVLNELLSTNNINLSNCGGYIGEILESPKHDENELNYTERRTATNYQYRLSDKYILDYDATAVTAAIDLPVPDRSNEVKEKIGIGEETKEDIER